MDIRKPRIISASRRTDIPAFFSKWFANRICKGWGVRYNPYNHRVSSVSLKPKDVAVIVFWSKDYKPLIPYLPLFDAGNFKLVFHFTITNLGAPYEENIPPFEQTVHDFRFLAQIYSPEQIFWRYDPIILTDKLDCHFHIDNFRRICRKLCGYTRRCYVNFMNIYKKVARRLEKEDIRLRFSHDEKKKLVITLNQIAEEYDIRLYSCCNDFLSDRIIKKGACIDAKLYQKLFNIDSRSYALKPSQKGCGCYESIDIGMYDTCMHRCLYCYANNSGSTVKRKYRQHDPHYPALCQDIHPDNIQGVKKTVKRQFLF